MDIELLYQPGKNQVSDLYEGLSEFNALHYSNTESERLAFVTRDNGGRIIAGASTVIRYSNMYVDVLWVHKEKRGGGLGAALLSRIIEECIVKGLSDLFLDTFTFQAPAFYEKFGFIEVGRFRNHPKKGIDKIFYQKELTKL